MCKAANADASRDLAPEAVRAAVEDNAALGTDHLREAGRLASFVGAEPALERRAEPSSPTLFVDHPRARPPRRPMAYVLLVAAGELGDPVAELVLVIADDGALHPARVRAALGRARRSGCGRRGGAQLGRNRLPRLRDDPDVRLR